MKTPKKIAGLRFLNRLTANIFRKRVLFITTILCLIALSLYFANLTNKNDSRDIWKIGEFFKKNELQEFNQNQQNYNNELQILNQGKVIAIFKVAIANDDEKRRHGLMNLKQLDRDKGMLFIFDHKQMISMWMKNTLIPLDMIFVDENDIVVNIRQDANPNSLELINSGLEVDKVIEINTGLVREFGIKVGDQMIVKPFF